MRTEFKVANRRMRNAECGINRATGLIRTLVVGAATLVILLVFFSIYQSSQLDPETAARLRTRRLPSTPTEPAGYTDTHGAQDTPGVALGQGIVGPGKKIQITLYPREGKRARLEIAVRDWTPVSGSSNEFLLSEPEARMRTKDGHAVRVTARRGILEAQRRSGGGLDPKRGTLTGDVVIEYDRLTETERARLPQELRNRIDPADLIRIETDEIEFDLEYSRLNVPGPIHLLARDVVFDAAGLEIRFNDVENRVEYMRIRHGGRLALHGTSESIGISIPGAGATGRSRLTLIQWLRSAIQARLDARQQQEQAERGHSSPPDIAFTEQGLPVFGHEMVDEKTAEPPVLYRARFEGSIDVQQLTGDVTHARLQADILEIIRELLIEDRAQVQSTGIVQPAQSDDTSSSHDQRLVLTWSDRLVVEVCSPEDERCKGDARSRITAIGTPARIHRPEGDATCAKLTYDPDKSKVSLYGIPADPVVVRYADRGTVTALEVHSERNGDEMILRAIGPGTLVRDAVETSTRTGTAQTEPNAPSIIEFADELEAHWRFVTRTRIDSTGRISFSEHPVLDRVSFVGRAKMRQDDTGISADALTVSFAAQQGFFSADAQTVERVAGWGHVSITRGADRLRCREVDIILTKDDSGRTFPLTATARGDVVAEQEGGSTIQARDKLIVDWVTRSRENEGKPRTEAVVKRLRAFGEVIFSDQAQAVDLAAEKLDCTLAEGRDIETALVEGLDDHPASVQLGAFTLTGRQIKLHVPDERADVPGAGRLTFHSRKDLDGREVTEPISIVITWSDRLEYRGSENRSVFYGNVHAVSETTTTFDCDRLVVEFDDVPAATDRIAGVDPRGRPRLEGEESSLPYPAGEDLWIFREIVGRLMPRSSERDRTTAAKRFSKEPAYILATGHAIALTSKIDPVSGALLSRVRIAGPRLSVNLRPDVLKMVIEGPGNLLLEDNRPPVRDSNPVPADKLADRAWGGLFGVDEDAGPSNTLIEWDDLMWYDFSIAQTRFEGNVSLKHFSGAELMRIRQRSLGGSADVPPGRATFLTCDALTLDFLDRDERSRRPPGRRMGRLSAAQLKQFEAKGSVVLQDQSEGLSVVSERLVYWKDRRLLAIYGTPQRKANIVIQKPGELPNQVSVKHLFYNLATGELEVSKPRLKAR